MANKISCMVLGAALVGCTMDNPAFDQARDVQGGTSEGDGDGDRDTSTGDGDAGDGDGDGDSSTGDGDGDGDTGDGDTGDGDGDSSTGDGDGDGTGDGDGDGDACNPGQTKCDGNCVDPQFDNENCGECGMACGFGQVCALAECLPKKYVFVSSYLFHGNFGGAIYANSACNDLAGNAQLPGTYFAWLSTPQGGPSGFLPPGPGAYLLPNGPLIATSWADLLDGQLLGPIDRNEFGGALVPAPACGMQVAVWTGTSDTGLPVEPNCGYWTLADNMSVGRVGDPLAVGAGWSESACAAPCGMPLPIYCVQQ